MNTAIQSQLTGDDTSFKRAVLGADHRLPHLGLAWALACLFLLYGINSHAITGESDLVDHYYRSVLNRAPDSGGKSYWLGEGGRMRSNGVDAVEAYLAMARYFYASDEFASNGYTDAQFVTSLYRTFLDREPDQGGLDYWTGILAAGLPRDMVMYAFMFSNEFSTLIEGVVASGNMRAEVGAVVDFYRGALGRLPDTAGLNDWVRRFRIAQCLPAAERAGGIYQLAIEIANGFFDSAEYWSEAVTPTRYVADLYNAFLRRSADQNGFEFWVKQLEDGERTFAQVRRSFIDSPEFAGRVAAIASEGCLTPVLQGFTLVSDEEWNATAVRKVLHAFAYGGHASDEQINAWADMPPWYAIEEMFTFTPSNPRLSPSDSDALGRLTDGTLESLAGFWSSDDPENALPDAFKNNYRIDNFFVSDCYEQDPGYNHGGNFVNTWIHSVLAKGSNPFLHRIGFWETNYHMVSNNGVNGVFFWHQMKQYDAIIGALMGDENYESVLAAGALSAAIGLQYGHANTYWIDGSGGFNGNYMEDGIFFGNEDFAREFHQLFFGVLGEEDHAYHETVTIRNTARALTDIRHRFVDVTVSAGCDYDKAHGWDAGIELGTDFHHGAALEVYGRQISGTDAEQKIRQLADIAVDQAESLDNLPIKLIGGLADDNLTPEKTAAIQAAWRAMEPKNLLTFLREYAISTTFHSADRIKYYTSFDRNLIVYNRLDIDNSELHRVIDADRGWRWDLPQDIQWHGFEQENVQPFHPIHDVFGHQRGIEAVGTPGVFRAVYNRSTEPWNFNFVVIRETDNWDNILWSKDMSQVIPRDAAGGYPVEHVAEVLWRRVVGDGLKNFGVLERAHIYSLLYDKGEDLGIRWRDEGLIGDENQVFTAQELVGNPAYASRIVQLGNMQMPLDSADLDQRTRANENITLALAFISASPYMFVQEGK